MDYSSDGETEVKNELGNSSIAKHEVPENNLSTERRARCGKWCSSRSREKLQPVVRLHSDYLDGLWFY